MNPKVGDLVVMRDDTMFEGMIGIVIAEETDHYYGKMLVNGKVRMFGGDDVEMVVQQEQAEVSHETQGR